MTILPSEDPYECCDHVWDLSKNCTRLYVFGHSEEVPSKYDHGRSGRGDYPEKLDQGGHTVAPSEHVYQAVQRGTLAASSTPGLASHTKWDLETC